MATSAPEAGSRPPRLRSISRDLTVAIAVMVFLVFSATSAVNYYYSSQEARQQLEGKADDYLAHLRGSLEVPLWNLDGETVRKIGDTYFQHEVFSRLRIVNSFGEVELARVREDAHPQVERRGAIIHAGKEIGWVEMALTSREYARNNQRLLWNSLITMVAVLVALMAFTGLALGVLIRKPLAALLKRIDRLAQGEFELPEEAVKHQELEIVIARTNHMARQIQQAMQALRESEEKYRHLFDNISDLVYIHDLGGHILSINAAATRALGYSPEQLKGREIASLMPEANRDGFAEIYLAPLLEKGRLEGVNTLLTSSGEPRYLEFSSQLVCPAGGEPYVQGSARDVTERMRSEKELRRLERQLFQAQKMEAVGTLASGIAHDFNNLLQGISGFVQLMLGSGASPAAHRFYLEEMDHAIARAGELVKGLMTFSRKVESQLEPMDLNREVTRVVMLLGRTLPKMISIETHLSPELHTISGDSIQLEQVLMNLVSNARDAMPEGGRLVIQTNNVTLDELYCRGMVNLRPGPFVRLTVTDSGHGMDKETLSHIFEPFFTTKDLGKGTGLGLSTVYGIVKSHGGHVTCYSEPGVGTIFNLYFPSLAARVEGEAARPAAAETIAGGSETILMVDDEPPILEAGREILSGYGYTPILAASGEQALEIIRERGRGIDLVILDLSMPGMGGRRCLAELMRLNPRLKVLISSGYSTPGQIEETNAQGAAGFIAKPYRLTDLLRMVRQTLDEPGR